MSVVTHKNQHYFATAATMSDSVSIAFEMILEEIDTVVVEVNSQGAAFLRNNEYPKAKAAIESGEKLAAFRLKLDALNLLKTDITVDVPCDRNLAQPEERRAMKRRTRKLKLTPFLGHCSDVG